MPIASNTIVHTAKLGGAVVAFEGQTKTLCIGNFVGLSSKDSGEAVFTARHVRGGDTHGRANVGCD